MPISEYSAAAAQGKPNLMADMAHSEPNEAKTSRQPGLRAYRIARAAVTVFLWLLPLANAASRAEGPCAPDKLPPRVAEMREAILDAAKGRKIEALREPIEWNELKPDFGAAGTDPIAHLKALSGDGSGVKLLAQLQAILEADCLEPAPDANAGLYVWPRLAGARLDKFSAEEDAMLAKLAGTEEIDAMRAVGRWTGWRIAIGRDGTWHSLKKGGN